MTSTSMVKVFAADLARFDAAFEALGAVGVVRDGDEDFKYIDSTRTPADLLRAYRRLVIFGAANGLI